MRILPSNACSTLTASLALVSKYGMLPLDWQKVMARFDEIIRLFSSTSILLPMTTYTGRISIGCHWSDDSSLAQVRALRNTQIWTHKGKAFGVTRARLNQKLISPAVERLETL